MFRLIVSTIVVTSAALIVTAQQPPKDEPVSVSPMAARKLQGCTFVHRSIETDFQNSAKDIEAGMKSLAAELNAAKIMPIGPAIVVLHNPTPEPGKKYTVEMGFPVTSTTKAPAHSKVRALEPLRAATVTFTGPISALGDAYKQLYEQIGQAGLTPGTEIRQYSVYWEGPDSPNNIMLLQVGLAK